MRFTRNTLKQGFTLIELLVVIAIIALLAAILFPVFARAREKARQASCQSNLKQIGLGIHQYAQDYDEHFPTFTQCYCADTPTANTPIWWNDSDGQLNYGQPWFQVIYPYLKSYQILVCPSTGGWSSALGREQISTSGGNPLIYPSYGYSRSFNFNDKWSTQVDNHRPFVGVNAAAVQQPANKIVVGELRRLTAPSYFGWVSTGNWAYYDSQPAIVDGYIGTAAYTTIPDCWGYSGSNCSGGVWNGANRHTIGSNFLFADGHVKLLGPATGVMYYESSSPQTDTNVRHWWDWSYDG